MKETADKARNRVTYEIEVFCKNCHYKGKVRIPKRIEIDEALKTKECPKCKCKTLLKYSLYSVECDKD